MNKVFRIFTVFALIVVVGITAVGVSLYSFGRSTEFITVSEKGDKSLLEDIVIESNFISSNEMSIHTSFVPSENKTETEIIYDEYGVVNNTSASWGLRESYSSLSYYMQCSEELKNAVEEKYKAFEEDGDTAFFRLKMKDYFDYYTYPVEAFFPNFEIYWSDSRDYNASYVINGISTERARGFVEAINEFIKIPVLASSSYSCWLRKDFYSMSWLSNEKFSFEPLSVCTQTKCFFSFENRVYSEQGNSYSYVDTSLIPNGYGIYMFPYGENDIYYEELENVFPLSSKSTVLGLKYVESGNILHAFVLENGEIVLYGIDAATYEKLFEIHAFELSDSDHIMFYGEDDFAVFYKNGESIRVYTIENNSHTLAVDCTVSEGSDLYEHFPYSTKYFDGENLFVVSDDDDFDSYSGASRSCTMRLYVVNRNGIAYYCKWYCSLGESNNNATKFCNFSYNDDAVKIFKRTENNDKMK